MSTSRPASASGLPGVLGSGPDGALWGQAGGGQLDRHAQQAEAGPADPGLGPGPLAGAQRELAELAEHPAGRAVLRRQLDRRAHLAEDLVLADHDRVEPGGHREQMAHRAVLVMHVQVLGELVRRQAAVPREQFADRGDARVEPVHVGVHLNPVAGRDDEGLGHGFGLHDVAEQLGESVTAYRDALQGRHRGALVAKADHQHTHLSTA